MRRLIAASTLTALLLPAMLLPSVAFAADDYKIDAAHSAVLFKAHHFGAGYTWGRFNEFDGTFEVDEQGNPTAINITVKAESVDTHNEKRDKHLRSPDFLNAGEFQTVTFKATEIKAAGEGKWTATGELTLHGVTKPITVEVTKAGEGKDPWGGYRYGFETAFSVERSDFGFFNEDGIGDTIAMTIAIEGTKKKL
ncbi:MAG: polyisoprenoid-binding protein YceI [Cognaticolwellia sp.]|jgi:polyisoprenoid-binding protein YceI